MHDAKKKKRNAEETSRKRYKNIVPDQWIWFVQNSDLGLRWSGPTLWSSRFSKLHSIRLAAHSFAFGPTGLVKSAGFLLNSWLDWGLLLSRWRIKQNSSSSTDGKEAYEENEIKLRTDLESSCSQNLSSTRWLYDPRFRYSRKEYFFFYVIAQRYCRREREIAIFKPTQILKTLWTRSLKWLLVSKISHQRFIIDFRIYRFILASWYQERISYYVAHSSARTFWRTFADDCTQPHSELRFELQSAHHAMPSIHPSFRSSNSSPLVNHPLYSCVILC